MSWRRRVLRWLLAPVSRVYAAVIVVVVCFGLGGAWALINHDEHSACVIQARGLPAGHELAQSMKKIYMLVTLPQPAAVEASMPPRVRRLESALKLHLANYLRAEDKQPATRSC